MRIQAPGRVIGTAGSGLVNAAGGTIGVCAA